MRLLLSIIATMLMAQSANAQALWRNFFTTNQNPLVTVVAGSNATVQASTVGVNQRIFTVNAIPGSSGFASNVYGTNVIGAVPEATHATNADFSSYSTNSGYATNAGFATNATTATNAILLESTGIGLADTNWVLQQISALGAYMYFGGPTNTFAITNSGETVSRTNIYTGSISPFVNASTSSVSGLILNAYVRHVISTNTFVEIEAGPVSITTYPWRTGGAGTVSGHYEFYVVDAVSNIMYELGSTPVLTISATAPTEVQTTMLVTNSFTATNLCYVALAFKIDDPGLAGPTLSWAHGGAYGAHLTFVRPLSSATIDASQITGVLSPVNLATNTPSASQVLTATSATTAEWQNPPPIVQGTNQGLLTISMAYEWSALNTNADFTIAGLSDVSTYGTNIQKHTMIITNTAGITKVMTLPASWVKHDGPSCYITNQGIMTLVVYPGMGTNAAFKCLK